MNVSLVVAILIMLVIWLMVWKWIIFPFLVLGAGLLIGLILRDLLSYAFNKLSNIG